MPTVLLGAASQLVAVRERLATVTSMMSSTAGVEIVLGAATGERWQPLPEAFDDLAGWHAALSEQYGDRRVAAAYLGGWLAQVPATAVALPAVLGAVVPRVSSERVMVRRHPQGWLDGHAFEPTDAVAADTLEDSDFVRLTIQRLLAVAEPIVGTVRSRLPLSSSVVWGTVVDATCSRALAAARSCGIDEYAVWRRLEGLLDRLQDAVPRLRRRPRLYPVTWSGGVSCFQVRSTCCLFYRTVEDADPDGEGYCSSCPLRTDVSRTRRLRVHLETTSGDPADPPDEVVAR